ncbi:MAG TPA: hypothetical protein VG123_31570 [Streptosporangiaceae bacterium]|jgi:hypothetical protein|nr:hypothetical protein [Streptosporangiaceae bacterium]
MRHLIGLVLAIALAAALFFGGGWGAAHVPALVGHSVGLPSRTGLIGLSAALATGVFLGILLVVPAISPLATGLPGLVLVGWTALLAVSAHRALAWIPLQGHSFGVGFRILLLNGTLALAGMAMIIPLFLPGRWHGRHNEDDADDDFDEIPAPTGLFSD